MPINDKEKWKPDTTRINSLRLLSFDPDRVGEMPARADFHPHYRIKAIKNASHYKPLK